MNDPHGSARSWPSFAGERKRSTLAHVKKEVYFIARPSNQNWSSEPTRMARHKTSDTLRFRFRTNNSGVDSFADRSITGGASGRKDFGETI